RGGAGRHGRQRHARSEAAAHAGRPGREEQIQGSEKMMLTILAESALRAFVLGGAVWLGLTLFRVRIPSAHMTAWIMVLLASLSMPLLMHWTTVTVTVEAPAMPSLPPLEALPSAESLRPEALPAVTAPEGGGVSAATSHLGHHGVAIDWWLVATVIYALVAAFMLLRLALGLHL